MLEWLEREDVPDDDFLQQLDDATLAVWDHYTHLRIAWLYLTRYGRRDGMQKIFSSIKSFIERSPRTRRGDTSRGTTFHETMTYFWTHMVHFAIVSSSSSKALPFEKPFKQFLVLNPQLSNGGLFLHYYSKKRMLLDAEARSSVLLPDIRPLPSLITHSDGSTASGPFATYSAVSAAAATPLHVRLQPRRPMTDEEFLNNVRTSSLRGWGHDVKIRLIYLLLSEDAREGRRRNAERVIDTLRGIEKDAFHLTITYFWIQMVSFSMKAVGSATSTQMEFDVFYRQPICQKLRNSLLYESYYSRRVMDADKAAVEFALPDLKSLPSVI